MLTKIALLSFAIANIILIIGALSFALYRMRKLLQRKKRHREEDQLQDEFPSEKRERERKIIFYYGTTDSVENRYRILLAAYKDDYIDFEFKVLDNSDQWPNILMICKIN